MTPRKVPADVALDPASLAALGRAERAVQDLVAVVAPGRRVYARAPQEAADLSRLGKRLLAALQAYRTAGGGQGKAA